MPEKNKNFFVLLTSLSNKTFTLSSASTILGPRYFVIFVLWFLSDLKGAQSVIGLCWPGHYFCQFDKHLPQPKTKCMHWIQSRNLLWYCLVFHLILDLILKTSFWANFYTTHKVLSYLVKHSIQRNMKRSSGKCEDAGQEKLITEKKRNESITLQNKSSLYKLYNWKIDGEMLHIFEKSSFLDLEPSAMIQNSRHFSPLLILQIWKFGSPWPSPSVNSQWYLKNECSDMS